MTPARGAVLSRWDTTVPVAASFRILRSSAVIVFHLAEGAATADGSGTGSPVGAQAVDVEPDGFGHELFDFFGVVPAATLVGMSELAVAPHLAVAREVFPDLAQLIQPLDRQ